MSFKKIFISVISLGLFLSCLTEAKKITESRSVNTRSRIKNDVTASEKEKQPEEKTDAVIDQDVISSSYNISILPSTSAGQVLLIDYDSGSILFEKNPDSLLDPSSMTKMVTASLVIGKIYLGELSPNTEFIVSKNAFRLEGSTAYLKLGQKVSVDDLLKCLIIQSANDASVALAEGICGSEEVFATEMTSFAKAIGCVNSTFVNASGLPEENHKSTARDLAIIAKYVVSNYPDYYPLYSTKEFCFNGVTKPNKNVLLGKGIGCDGIKTGHTSSGGYGVAVSCLQNGRRLILIVNGYKSEIERTNDSSALIAWGMKMFRNKKLYKSNELVTKIPVWYGEESYLPVTVENDVTFTVPNNIDIKDIRAVLCYETPISAPIQKGEKVGEIQIISSSFKQNISIPLIAGVAVREAGVWKKIKDSLNYLIFGIRKPEIL